MVRVIGLVVVGGVATVAIGGRSHRVVSVVAIITINIGMCPIQWIKIVVIKRRGYPGSLCMTGGTIGGELRRYVVGIRRTIIIRGMATRAGVGRIRVIALVTFVATHCGMRSI